jgi:hypothetical protein
MSYSLKLEETKYYIAVQDGPLDNQVFDTFEEAEQARQKLKLISESTYNSTMVASRIVTKKLLTE